MSVWVGGSLVETLRDCLFGGNVRVSEWVRLYSNLVIGLVVRKKLTLTAASSKIYNQTDGKISRYRNRQMTDRGRSLEVYLPG